MAQCQYFSEAISPSTSEKFGYGYCLGQKGMPNCYCMGDKGKCDELSIKPKLEFTTLEMLTIAGKDYTRYFKVDTHNGTNTVTYNYLEGFLTTSIAMPWGNLNQFIKENKWKEFTPTPKMTKTEVLEKYGVKVID